MLSIVNLVMSDYRTAVGSDLNTSESISINIIALYQTSAIPKYVNATLVSIKYSITPGGKKQNYADAGLLNLIKHFTVKFDTAARNKQNKKLTHKPNGRVAVWCNPNTSKVIGIDLILDELAAALLVHVDAPGLAVVNLTTHYCGVGIGLHLEACDPVSVDVAALKVAL